MFVEAGQHTVLAPAASFDRYRITDKYVQSVTEKIKNHKESLKRKMDIKNTPAVKCSTGYSLCLNLDTDDTGKPILLPELVIALL